MYSDIFKYCLFSSGKFHPNPPAPYSVVDLPSQGFSGVYQIDETTAKALHEAGTTAGFKGVVWSPWLKIDVDTYEAAETAERKLVEMELEYEAYDSGGRGAHFYIRRDIRPSHRLPSRDKAWAAHFFPEADLSIYHHCALFRLIGSKHEDTGRAKELVSVGKGRPLILPKEDLGDTRTTIPNNYASSNSRSVFDCLRVMAHSVPLSAGEERHPQLVKLAYGLKEQAQVDENIALWWALEVNKTFAEPKSEEEVAKIVGSIYR